MNNILEYSIMKTISKSPLLNTYFNEENEWEIGVDEAGRGPLFGRLYVAATILPKTGFRHE